MLAACGSTKTQYVPSGSARTSTNPPDPDEGRRHERRPVLEVDRDPRAGQRDVRGEQADALHGDAGEAQPPVLSRRAEGEVDRRATGRDRAHDVRRHVVEREGHAARVARLRVDEDRVQAGRGQHAHVDEAARAADRRGRGERRPVRSGARDLRQGHADGAGSRLTTRPAVPSNRRVAFCRPWSSSP